MDKHKVEAVLFALGKEASIERLASLCSLSEKQVEKSLNEIQKETFLRYPYFVNTVCC